MQAELWTLSGLAVELSRDRRSLARDLEGLTPDDESTDNAGRVSRRWRMARVFSHLAVGGSSDEYDDQRQRLAAAQSEKVEHENAVRRGRLADMREVERFWTNAIANARAKALAIPSKLSPRLVNIGDATVISAAIRAEVYAFLTELVDYAPGEPERVDTEVVPDVGAPAGLNGQRVGGPRAKTERRVKRRAGAVED